MYNNPEFRLAHYRALCPLSKFDTLWVLAVYCRVSWR